LKHDLHAPQTVLTGGDPGFGFVDFAANNVSLHSHVDCKTRGQLQQVL
jgi:hypothetical protein